MKLTHAKLNKKAIYKKLSGNFWNFWEVKRVRLVGYTVQSKASHNFVKRVKQRHTAETAGHRCHNLYHLSWRVGTLFGPISSTAQKMGSQHSLLLHISCFHLKSGVVGSGGESLGHVPLWL